MRRFCYTIVALLMAIALIAIAVQIEFARGVSVPPVAVITPASTTVAVSATFNLDGSSSYDPDGGEIIYYQWDVDNDGVYDAMGVTLSHSYSAVGIYPVSLRVTDEQGDADITVATVTVVSPFPIAEFTESTHTALVDETINFDASGSHDPLGDAIILYEWDWDTNGVYDSSSTSPTASHAYSTADTYTVTLKVTDASGLTNTTSDTKTILEGPDFVVPEVPMGTLVVSITMIIGLICYFAVPKVHKKEA